MKLPTLLAGFAAMLVASSGSEAFGAAAGHPYAAIVERNAFGLRPVPPPQVPPQPEPPPVPTRDIKLTGISTLLGKPQVFIEIIDPETKTTERPPGLEVGEEQFEVEIVSIDPEEGVVRIRNRGEEATLDFVNNGIKPGAPAVAAAGRGRVPVPVPTRNTAVPTPRAPVRASSLAAIPASTSVGSRAIVSGGPGGASTVTAPRPGISPEAEARIEAYRRILEARQRAGNMPSVPAPVPPTRLRR